MPPIHPPTQALHPRLQLPRLLGSGLYPRGGYGYQPQAHVWLATPAYGWGTCVRGTVRLLDKDPYIKSVKAKVRLCFTSNSRVGNDSRANSRLVGQSCRALWRSTLTLGGLTGPESVPLIEVVQTLALRAYSEVPLYAFTFWLLGRVSINGAETPLPPSSSTTTYESTWTIAYILRFELRRAAQARNVSYISGWEWTWKRRMG